MASFAWRLDGINIITCTDYATDPATTNLGDCPPAPLSDGGLWPYPGVGSATPYSDDDFYSGGGEGLTSYAGNIFMQITGGGYDTATVTLTPQSPFNGFKWWEGTASYYDSSVPVSVFVGNGQSGLGTGIAGIWVSPLGSLEPSVYMNMACYGSDISDVQCTQSPYLFQAADASGPSQVNPLYGTSPTAILWDNIPTELLVTTSGPGGSMTPIAITRTVPATTGTPGSALWQYWNDGVLQWQLDYGISVPCKWTLNGLFTKASFQGTPVSAPDATADYSSSSGGFAVEMGAL